MPSCLSRFDPPHSVNCTDVMRCDRGDPVLYLTCIIAPACQTLADDLIKYKHPGSKKFHIHTWESDSLI